MVIVLKQGATDDDLSKVVDHLQHMNLSVHVSKGVHQTVIGVLGDEKQEVMNQMETMEAVERVIPIMKPYKLANRDFRPEPSTIIIGDLTFGPKDFQIMAGPCSVEGYDQVHETALAVKAAGVKILRGGAYKPRTSPYSFQGKGVEGLQILDTVAKETGLQVITEVLDPRDVQVVAEHSAILQIGTRNMENFQLLREVGLTNRPVLLKRGRAATLEEWLLAAEYIMKEGNHNVILCERGIRSFDTHTRNVLDITAVPALKHLSHLPVVVDPSHSTGKWRYVAPAALASMAAGADGLLIEIHPRPDEAWSDGPQSLNLPRFTALVDDLRKMAPIFNRSL